MSDYRISGHSRQEFRGPVEPQDPVFRIPYDDRGIRIIDQALKVLARAAQGILDPFRAIAVATRSVTARIRSSSSSKKEGLSQVPNESVPMVHAPGR